MLVHLFQITFLNQYIVSPKTWIHKISSNIKIPIALIYLFCIPYVHYKYMILSTIIYTIMVINLPIPKKYIISIGQIVYILCVCLLNIYIYTNNNIVDTQKQTNINIVQCSGKATFPALTNIHYKTFAFTTIVPSYILRGIIIYTIYLALLKTIFLTTKYEDVIISCIVISRHSINQRYSISKKFFLILCSNFIILLMNQIEITIQSIILRCSPSKYIYYYALHDLFISILINIRRIVCILYYREIQEITIHEGLKTTRI